MVAAIEGRTEIATMLLQAGANANACDLRGYTPLMGAACSGNSRIVQQLLAHGARLDDVCERSGATALHDAAARQETDILRQLLAAGACPNAAETKDGKTPLMCAVEKLNLPAVKLLLEYGAEPHTRNSRGETAALLLSYIQPTLWHPHRIRRAQAISQLLPQP